MEKQEIINEIVQRVKEIPGVEAIALGGSRARNAHTSDSDIDIGIYYYPDSPIDLQLLGKAVSDLDDQHRDDLLTGALGSMEVDG